MTDLEKSEARLYVWLGPIEAKATHKLDSSAVLARAGAAGTLLQAVAKGCFAKHAKLTLQQVCRHLPLEFPQADGLYKLLKRLAGSILPELSEGEVLEVLQPRVAKEDPYQDLLEDEEDNALLDGIERRRLKQTQATVSFQNIMFVFAA